MRRTRRRAAQLLLQHMQSGSVSLLRLGRRWAAPAARLPPAGHHLQTTKGSSVFFLLFGTKGVLYNKKMCYILWPATASLLLNVICPNPGQQRGARAPVTPYNGLAIDGSSPDESSRLFRIGCSSRLLNWKSIGILGIPDARDSATEKKTHTSTKHSSRFSRKVFCC